MDKKLRFLWWGVLGALLFAASIKFLLPVKSPVKMEQATVNREIIVFITGAVNHPGLLHLPLDARLADALEKAELSYDADMEVLNPAQKLKDGQKIIVPHRIPAEIPTEGDEVLTGSTLTEGSREVETLEKTSESTANKVNINHAGVGELDTIPGIGPAIAQRIVDYREQNGLFSSPEEIQNVSGIGPKTYEKMASFITVGY